MYFFFQNISFMATYLVVLLQFKLTLLRQTAKNALLTSLRERANRTSMQSENITETIVE